MLELIAHILGFCGMVLVVLCYYLNISGYWKTSGERYAVTNLFGAILLLVSLCVHFNLGSFIIELFWIAISVQGLIKVRREKGCLYCTKHPLKFLLSYRDI